MKPKAAFKSITLAGIIIISVFAGWGLNILPISTVFFESLNNRIYDIIVGLNQPDVQEAALDDVIIVDFDKKSISTLGRFSSWPNTLFINTLSYLHQGKAKAIGFDVFFTESDSLLPIALESLTDDIATKTQLDTLLIKEILIAQSTDLELARAFQKSGNVYLAMFNQIGYVDSSVVLPDKLKPWPIHPKSIYELTNPVPPIPILAKAAYGIGFAHIEPNRNGIIHDYPLFFHYKQKIYLNFSFQMCLDLLSIDNIKQTKNSIELYKNNELIRKLPLDDRGKLYLKFYGKGHTFRTISFSDIVLQRISCNYFRDKIVLFGSSATGLTDLKTTPSDNHYPGVELHATLIKNILDHDFVHFISKFYLILAAILVLLILIFCITKYNPKISISVYILCLIACFVAFFLLYHYASISLNYSAFLLPWNLGFGLTIFYQFHLYLKEKRSLRNAFEHYVAKDVVKKIMDDPTQLKAGGKLCPVSALFSDLRNFSYFCERAKPNDVVELLNHYFNLVTPHVVNSNGMLDKYDGDAVVALFNVPIEKPDYPYDACMAALQIVKVADAIRKEYSSHPIFNIFKNGVGIATGDLIVGNIGSDNIFNYTGIGDVMNIASRLEGLNKFYGTRIIIDENTYKVVKDKLIIRKIDCVSVKGRHDCMTIYEVMNSDSISEVSLEQCAIMYETALNDYSHGKWERALENFEALLLQFPDDAPSLYMKNRILRYNRVAFEQFDGVWNFNEK